MGQNELKKTHCVRNEIIKILEKLDNGDGGFCLVRFYNT